MLVEKIKQKLIAELDELIKIGESLPMHQHSRVTRTNFRTGEQTRQNYSLASHPEFIEWRTSSIAILDQAVPGSSLLRQTVNSFHTINSEPNQVQFAVAFLRSVRKELARGSLDSIALQIEATVLTDYMTQASSLLEETKEGAAYIPAAVLAGASLERSLRTLCQNLEPPEPVMNDRDGFLGMSALIDALKKRLVFNELQAKQLRAWAAIRNSAAHGKYDEFSRHQVEQMIEGIDAFLAQHVR